VNVNPPQTKKQENLT